MARVRRGCIHSGLTVGSGPLVNYARAAKGNGAKRPANTLHIPVGALRGRPPVG